MRIYGAGLSGLLAAYVFPQATIHEALPRDTLLERHHKALLRFRTDAIGRMTGIEFKKVRVTKGIFHGKDYVAPSIAMANMYSQKVIGRLADRSILNIDPVERYVAPDDFQQQLFAAVESRIAFKDESFAEAANPFRRDDANPIISTIPMFNALSAVESRSIPDRRLFVRTPIRVLRATISNADVYQTVYYPSPKHGVYRASITGDKLIIESIHNAVEGQESRNAIITFVAETMAIDLDSIDEVSETAMAFGKIAPVDEALRRSVILDLTMMYNIYSAGRFAIWKNILLDDLLDDLFLIKRMIGRNCKYETVKEAHKNESHSA